MASDATKHLCFGMAEPNYMHSVGVPYSKLKKEIPDFAGMTIKKI